MKIEAKNLGKVTLTCNGYWDINTEYDKLCLVTNKVDGNLISYISKIPVPKGIGITNTDYWQSLETIPDNLIAICNNIYLQWNKSYADTRLQIPLLFRRKGIIISYKTPNNDIRTEKLVTDLPITDEVIIEDRNWSYISDALNITGNVNIGTNGNWFVNDTDTGFQARGPKGDNGLYPIFRNRDNRLEYSYDNTKWFFISDYIAASFRFQDNKIQITKDNIRWNDLTDEFGRFKILDYKTTVEQLPTDANQGDMYMVGSVSPYRLYVKNSDGWKDNGSFLGLSVGLLDNIGEKPDVAISQYAVTRHITEYNVSNHFTNANNTNDHSPVEAIRLIPLYVRKYGLKCSFITKLTFINNKVETTKLKHTTMQYVGTSLEIETWKDINNWEPITPIYLTEVEYEQLVNKEYLLFYIEETEV